MKTSMKQGWIKNLLSGEFEQGVGFLCCADLDGTLKYCCLGVLAETCGLKKEQSIDKRLFKYDDAYYSLRYSVLDGEIQKKLINMNDVVKNNFAEIASWIQDNVPEEPDEDTSCVASTV